MTAGKRNNPVPHTPFLLIVLVLSASLQILGMTPVLLIALAGGVIALVAVAGLAIIVVSRRRKTVTWRQSDSSNYSVFSSRVK